MPHRFIVIGFAANGANIFLCFFDKVSIKKILGLIFVIASRDVLWLLDSDFSRMPRNLNASALAPRGMFCCVDCVKACIFA